MENQDLIKRLDFIEFRQQLLFYNDEMSRLLFEYKITENQYKSLMDLMEQYENKIQNGENVTHMGFEQSVYEIVPERHGDYHFCEYLAKTFYEENRWVDVFPAIYGNFSKYSHVKQK